MNERTLQRRLDAQKIRFTDILDRVRRKQAREFLAQSALPLSEKTKKNSGGSARLQ
jgi:hypothetical protein